jgi:hypothetical protein
LAWGAAAAAYAGLTAWATWPLPAGAGHHVVDAVALQGSFGWLTLADVRLVIWALAWDVHALGTAPLALFDANIFHPARWALARSDHFLGNLPVFAPIYLASGNPVLAHQAVLLLGFPLSALAMAAAAEAWTGSFAAGFVAGLFFGLGPWRFVQLAHVQLLSTFYLPLVLLFGWRVAIRGGAGRGAALALLTALQALCSVYLGVAAFAAAGAMLAGTWLGVRGQPSPRPLVGLAAVAAAAAVVLAISWPYVSLAHLGAIPHVTGALAASGTPLELAGAAPLATYLLPHHAGTARGYYFLGWTCAALAVIGALVRSRSVPAVRAGLLLVVLVGWLMSLGYRWRLPGGAVVSLPLGWLAAALPSVGSLRAPLRLGVVVTVAAAALAGLGYAWLEQRIGGPVRRTGLALAVVSLALVELAPRPIPLRRVPVGGDVPPVYRWLASAPPGPVLELPVGFVDHDFVGDVAAVGWQSGYEYLSTVHWKPLLNGYSGYPPESFYLLMAIARRLPAADALQDLVDLSGVRWVVVHEAALPSLAEAWERRPERSLVRRAEFGHDVVYEVTLAPRRDLTPLLRSEAPRRETLGGLPRTPLPPGALRAELDQLSVPRTIFAGGLARASVSVTNTSAWTWPALDPVRDGLVGVSYRWRGIDGEPVARALFTRLAHDLAPGETARVPFGIIAPAEPGHYEIVVTLRQDGGPWFDAAGVFARTAVEVRPWPRRDTPGAAAP